MCLSILEQQFGTVGRTSYRRQLWCTSYHLQNADIYRYLLTGPWGRDAKTQSFPPLQPSPTERHQPNARTTKKFEIALKARARDRTTSTTPPIAFNYVHPIILDAVELSQNVCRAASESESRVKSTNETPQSSWRRLTRCLQRRGEALKVNISAGEGLQDVLKSNLGPLGTIKMYLLPFLHACVRAKTDSRF